MNIQNLKVGETYQTTSSPRRGFHWALLEYTGRNRVKVQRADNPRIVFELNANDFASLVEPVHPEG